MRQFLEDIQNQNHILQEQISSLSERDISKSHSHSMNDFISPNMRGNIEDVIEGSLVETSSKTQVQLIYLSK